MGNVTQTPMRPAEAGSAASAPDDASPDRSRPAGSPVPAGTGRNLEGHRWVGRPADAFTVEDLTQRLIGTIRSWRDYPASLRLWFWLIPVLTAALGGILRFVRLDAPHKLVFDETYYVKDGYSFLVSGYERAWPEKANDAFIAGNPGVLLDSPEYVVHPPVGKWMIAAGMWLFGPESSFGWRFGAALTGTLSIFLLALIAQKLFRSLTLGAVAGVLLAVDGHHLVMSRTSLLDIFLMFWVLAAFGALLMDRDDGRRRLAARLGRQAADSPGGVPSRLQLAAGPWLGIRWWRLAAGVCLGLAVGTKWSALFFLAGFGLLTVLWDLSARRIAGVHGWITGGILKDGILAFLSIVPVAALVYTATWAGWFRSGNAYFRHWAEGNPSAEWGWIPDPLRSLAHYHLEAYKFHQGLSADHPYEASAWSWLVLGRPTSFFYESPKQGTAGCELPSCTSAILSVGQSADLVERGTGPRGAAVLVGRAPRLACRGHPGRRGRRLPALVPVPGTHHVLLLRGVLRTVPGARPHLLPGAGAGPAHGPALAAPLRALPRDAVRRGRRAALGLLLPRLDRGADFLPGLAVPDVDAVLDLGQDY